MASTLTSITGLQNLINLQDFRADWNSFVSVDLSGLANLTYVDISDCDIPGGGGESLTSVNLSGCTALEELRLDDSNFSGGMPDLTGLNSLVYFDFDQCQISDSIDISFLPSLEDLDLSGNEDLAEVIISSSQPLGNGGLQSLNFSDCGLTQPSVDAILVALSENGISNATVDLSGGGNDTPSGVGLSAKSLLESNGWTVYIN